MNFAQDEQATTWPPLVATVELAVRWTKNMFMKSEEIKMYGIERSYVNVTKGGV